MNTESADPIAILCPTCDGLGYLHGDVPLTCTDALHRATLSNIVPCNNCSPCPDCGHDGCAPGVRWADDLLVDATSARELAEAERLIEELDAEVVEARKRIRDIEAKEADR